MLSPTNQLVHNELANFSWTINGLKYLKYFEIAKGTLPWQPNLE